MKLPKFFKKSRKSTSSSLRKEVEIDPFFYWKKILIIMFCVLVVVAGISFVLYYAVNHEKLIDVKSREEVKTLENLELKIDDLNKSINTFNDRVMMRKEIIDTVSTIADPSIKAQPANVKKDVTPVVQKP